MRHRAFVPLLIGLGTLVGPAWADEPTTPRRPRAEDLVPADERVTVGPIATHVVRRGASGPAVVLIHGLGSSTYTWRRNLNTLGAGCRVFARDLKGVGRTARPRDGQYHPAAHVARVREFLDGMGLEKPILVGNPLGGAAALQRALENPGRVGGLVLVDAAPLGLGSPSPPGRAGGPRLNPILFQAMIARGLVERGLKASHHDPSIVTPEMVEADDRPTTLDGAAEAMAAMVSPPAGAEPRELPPLRSLAIPVLIVGGPHDRGVPVAVADACNPLIIDFAPVVAKAAAPSRASSKDPGS